MDNYKRKIKVLIAIAMLTMVTACSTKAERIVDYSSLKDSMRCFHTLESLCHTEGDSFDLKVMKAGKTVTDDSYYYQYRVSFAPIRNTNIQIKKVAFENDEAIEKTFFNNGMSMPDSNVVEGYFDDMAFKDMNDFEAFDWSVTRRVSKAIIEKNGISEAQLDDYMSRLSLTISFNLTRETLSANVSGFESEGDIAEYRFGILKN